MTRIQYSPYVDYGISTKNEPWCSLQPKLIDMHRYPDMHSAYEKASQLLEVPVDYSIILGNGCENVFKNVLLALKPRSISFSTPCWGMVNVIASQLQIQQHCKEFMYDDMKNALVEDESFDEYDVHYSTFPSNNFYKTTLSMNVHSKYNIIDCSYMNPIGICNKLKNILHENTIIVGGFQKEFGCGIRLGYAIFHMSLAKYIDEQRENYLNAVACSIIKTCTHDDFNVCIQANDLYVKRIQTSCKSLHNPYFLCNQFLTIVDCNVAPNFPHKTFNIQGKDFIRIGVAYTNQRKKEIEAYLLNACG